MPEAQTNETVIERRFFASPSVRIEEGETGKRLVGYAAVFNKLSVELGWSRFRERIAPGAFIETIKSDDIRALVDHDSSRILGRNVARTLRLQEDEEGLLSDIDVPDTSVGRDALISVSRGDISGMSFAFQTLSESWDYGDDDSDEPPIRTLNKVKLFDVSIVTYPAYPDTSVGVRSLERWLKEQEPTGAGALARMNMRLRLTDVAGI